MAEPASRPDLSEEHEAATVVASDWSSVAEHEPPAFAALFLGDQGEKTARPLVCEGEQCEFLASVKRGDDPRRPTAEPSAAGIEQNGPPKLIGAHYVRPHVLSHTHEKACDSPRPLRAEAGAAHCLRQPPSRRLQPCVRPRSTTDVSSAALLQRARHVWAGHSEIVKDLRCPSGVS